MKLLLVTSTLYSKTVYCGMDFSVDLLHTMESEMKSEIQKLLKAVNVSTTSELNETVLIRHLNKNPLAKFVESLANLIEKNVELCKSAAGQIDQLKSEKIADQKLIIEIQQGQINSVQDTVKAEMKTWADIAKKNVNQRSGRQLTENSVKQAVRIVNEEERRSRNLMIYGYPETENETDSEITRNVKNVYQEMDCLVPKTIDIYRMGKKEPGKTRPIKVEFTNSGDVEFALVHARKLKTGQLNSVYLGPDRTKEERLAHNKLVKQMKIMIEKDSNKHYYIRNKKICSADKVLSSQDLPSS